MRAGNRALNARGRITCVAYTDGSKLGGYEVLDDSASNIEIALSEAVKAFEVSRKLSPKNREAILRDAASAFAGKADEIARLLTLETGKPIALARAEIAGALTARDSILNVAASEALRNRTITEPMFVPVGSRQRANFIRRYPIGVTLSASYSFHPIAIAAHEFAATIAAGAATLYFPLHITFLSVLAFGEVISDLLGERAFFTVIPGTGVLMERMLADDRAAMLSYYCDIALDVAKERARGLASIAGGKPCRFHIGSRAAAVVMNGCNVKRAAELLARGAFANAGRNMHAIKTVLVQNGVYGEFRDAFVETAKTIGRAGDPMDEKTVVPIARYKVPPTALFEHLDNLKAEGAEVLCGGAVDERDAGDEGSIGSDRRFDATVLEGVPIDSSLRKFIEPAPICDIAPFATLDDAVALIKRLGFDFVIGLFCREQSDALHIIENVRVGTVIVNEYPLEIEPGALYRSTGRMSGANMGVRFAIDELTEPRNLLFNNWIE